MKTDFNLEDSFRIFDIEGKCEINLRELEEGLNSLALFPRKEELLLLFQQFDLDQDGKLDFKEFSLMILPKDKNYASLVLNRKSYH